MTDFTFTPKSEAQIAESNLWPEGEYAFEILDQATMGSNTFYTMNSVSKKSGAPMLQLIVKVYNSEGKFKIIIDYLIASMEYKVRHAAAACGLLDLYETGRLHSDDFKGKQGFLTLRNKPASKDKVTGKEYPAKNEVKDYVVSDDEKDMSFVPPKGHPANASFDDEIKF